MESLVQDFAQTFRVLRKSPVFTATAIVALALGIGASTAIFSVVNAVLLNPLPFPEPARLMKVGHSFRGEPTTVWASPAQFAHWQAQTDVLEDVAAWRTVSLDYAAGDTPETVTAAAVSQKYFPALRARFAVGRGFSAEEDLPGAADTAVLSHRFWMRRLNGDPDVVGKTILLGGVATTVIGVADKSFDVHDLNFRDASRPDVWVPIRIPPSTTDLTYSLDVLARLKPGVPLKDAQQRLAASFEDYRERFPADARDPGWSFTAIGMQEAIVRDSRSMLLILSGAVVLVLLVACANVANLMLVRALTRGHEIAICSALGAARWRVARQLLIESLSLALCGGALGLVAGVIGIRSILSISTADLPRLGDTDSVVGVDWRVLSFTLGTSIVTALVFGLAPAFAAGRVDLNSLIKSATGRSGRDRRQSAMQSALVTIEIALAVVLVIGAGLLIRTSLALGALDLGMSVDNVLTMRTLLADTRFHSATGLADASRVVLERLRSIPGVEVAAIAYGLPLQDNMFVPFDIVGRQNAGPATGGSVAVPSSAEYFDSLEIRVLAGRRFNDQDVRGSPPVVVVNQAFADRYWADRGDALGARIRLAANLIPEAADEPEREVIGIVGNVRQRGFMDDAQPTLYFPIAQLSDGIVGLMTSNAPFAWIVRTATDPRGLSALVHKAVREGTGQPVTDIRLMKETWAQSISRQRLNTWLITLFGGAALLLGTVGVYGLMSYVAEQRKHEIGIRMALGAESRTVRDMVIRQGMRLALAGTVVGVANAFVLANALAATLFGVTPHDFVVFATVPSVLALVALVAVVVPAVRASRVEPTQALRHI
jgi:putative ABC transport system permease protein